MCGICLLLQCGEGYSVESKELNIPQSDCDQWGEISNSIKRRGPDHFNEVCIERKWTLTGAVLQMRGDEEPTSQPYGKGDMLLWNGEVFDGLDVMSNVTENDTKMVYKHIQQNLVKLSLVEAVITSLQDIQGPYSFIFFHKETDSVVFGRDPLGRRSLLYSRNSNSLLLCSTAHSCENTFAEVPVGKICSLSLSKTSEDKTHITIDTTPWSDPLYSKPFQATKCLQNQQIPQSEANQIYLTSLQEAVKKRVVLSSHAKRRSNSETKQTESRIGILYSGGVDCAILAGICERDVPKGESIDLLNVAFGVSPSTTPDRLASRHGWAELCKTYPDREWNLIEISIKSADIIQNVSHIKNLLNPTDTVMDLNIGSALWFASRGVGSLVPKAAVEHTTPPPSLIRTIGSSLDLNPPRHDKGFSYLVDAIRQELSWCRDSVTVSDLSHAHEIPYRAAGYKKISDYIQAASLSGVVCCTGKGTTLAVSLTGKALEEHEIVRKIANSESDTVQSGATVLLVGMGADETNGGYSRYRNVFTKSGGSEEGLKMLAKEMQSDFDRLWTRNLGRDDRIISDHGKEARFPFLDENVLQVLQSLHLSNICDLSLMMGVGDKRLIRDAAVSVGAKSAATLQKRAIQFGTRLANNKINGETPLEVDSDDLLKQVEECFDPIKRDSRKRRQR